MNYTVYTDGACSGNPGPGGYAGIFVVNDHKKMTITGRSSSTTNNHMELKAIVRSLKHLLSGDYRIRQGKILIYSDSAYCINSINQGWYKFWKENEWRTKQDQEVKNKELWEELYYLLEDTRRVKVIFKKVHGHSGVKWNEEADKLAKQAMESKMNG